MSAINYQDLFDFQGFKDAIKEAQAQNAEFATGIQNVFKSLKTDIDATNNALRQNITTLQNFNVTQRNAVQSIQQISQQNDALIKKSGHLNVVSSKLAETTTLVKDSTNGLNIVAKSLEAEYNSLGDTEEKDILRKQEIINTVKILTDAINNFNGVNEKSIGSFNQLKNQYRDALTYAEKLKVDLGENSEEYLNAAAAAEKYALQLANVNAQIKAKPSIEDIPLTTNVDQVNKENQKISSLNGTAVSKEDIEATERQLQVTKELNSERGKSIVVLNEQADEILKTTVTENEYSSTIKQSVTSLAANSSELESIRIAQQELINEINITGEATESQSVKLSSLNKQETNLIQVNEELISSLRSQISSFNSTDESVIAFSANVTKLITNLETLSATKVNTVVSSTVESNSNSDVNLSSQQALDEETVISNTLTREQIDLLTQSAATEQEINEIKLKSFSTQAELNDVIQTYVGLLSEDISESAEDATVTKLITEAKDKLAFALSETNTQLKGYALQTELANKAAKDEAAVTLGLTGAYEKLTIDTAIAKKEAQQIGAQYGSTSVKFKEAAASANLLDKELKLIDAGVGNNQRNVGAYTQGILGSIKGITGGVRQLANILPGIGQQGLYLLAFEAVNKGIDLLLSNLDLLKTKTTVINETFKGTDEQTTVLKASLASYGSTAQEIADGALKDLEEQESKLNDQLNLTPSAVDKAKAALQILKVEAVDTQKAIDNLNSTPDAGGEGGGLGNVAAIAYEQRLNDNLDKQKKITDELQKERNKQTQVNNQEADKLNQQYSVDDLKINIDRNKSIIDNDKNSYSKRLSALNENFSKEKQLNLINKTQEVSTAINSTNIADDAQNKINVIKEKYRVQDIKATDDYNKELEKLNNPKADTKTYDRALRLYKEELTKEENLAKQQYDEEVLQAQQLLDKKIITETDFQKTKANAAEEYAKKVTAIETKANTVGYQADLSKLKEFQNFKLSAQNDYIKSSVKATDDLYKEDIELQQKAIEDEYNLRISSLSKEKDLALSDTRITNFGRHALEVEYQDSIDELNIESLNKRSDLELDTVKKNALIQQAELLKISIKARDLQYKSVTKPQDFEDLGIKFLEDGFNKRKALNIATTKDLVQTLEKEKAIYEIYGRDVTDIDKKIAEARIQNIEDVFNSFQKNIQSLSAIAGEGVGEVFSSLGDFIKNVAEEGKASLEDSLNAVGGVAQGVITQLNQADETRIQTIEKNKERELTLAGNNAAAQQAITERAAQQEAKIKRKEAVNNKIAALFSIAINTAVAATKTLGETGIFGIPLLPIIIGLGAAEAAVVLAQPLPAYEKGTEHAKEGFAVVDEKGTELIVDRHGKLKEVGSDENIGKGRVTHLSEGDKVYTHEKTKEIFKEAVENKSKKSEIVSKIVNLLNETKSQNFSQSYFKQKDVKNAQADNQDVSKVSVVSNKENNLNEKSYSQNKEAESKNQFIDRSFPLLHNLLSKSDASQKSNTTNNILKEIVLNEQLSNNIRDSKRSESINVMSTALKTNNFNEKFIAAEFSKAVKEIPLSQTIIDDNGQRKREIKITGIKNYRNTLNFGN